jgi:hypothetical protein
LGYNGAIIACRGTPEEARMAKKTNRKPPKGSPSTAGSGRPAASSKERRPKAREMLKRSDHERRKAFQGERKPAE